MSCIQKAETLKSLHLPWVFNIKGHHALHTEGGDTGFIAPTMDSCGDRSQRRPESAETGVSGDRSQRHKAEPPKRRGRHKAEPPCYGVFNIKGHIELHTEGGAPKKE